MTAWFKRTVLSVVKNLHPSRYNDLVLRPQRHSNIGDQAARAKIAIYVIFPKYGVQPSHIHALKYIVENGYSPLVVSNLPLTLHDMARLSPWAWRIMQRVNFGYDFGGYRDAILDLQDRLTKIDRLVFLNDSCWFPLVGSENWLCRAEDSAMDVYGAELHREMMAPTVRNFTHADWKHDRDAKRLYIPSFAISIGPNVLKHPDYITFWKNLRLSDGKGRTVRRGEHGHSNWLRRRGFSYDALLKSFDLDIVLSNLSSVLFDQVWSFFLSDHKDAKVVSTYHDLNSGVVNDALRARRRNFILNTAAHTGHAICIPHFAITQQAYPFLKKRTDSPNGTNIAVLEKIILDLKDPFSPEMLAEHKQRYQTS